MIKFIKAFYLVINVLIVLVLLALHFFIKDRTYESSLWFYLLPLPVIVNIVLVLSIFLGKRRKYNLILAGLLLIVWLGRSFKIHRSDVIKHSDLEVVFWNASHDNNFEEVFELIENIPDVLVLAESKYNDIKKLQLKYPDYFFYISNNEINVFSKTPLQIESTNTSKYHSSIINIKTAGINFYALDVQGSIDVPREWELSFVNSLIKKKENTIILGDFNLPYESVYFKKIKKEFNQAWKDADIEITDSVF